MTDSGNDFHSRRFGKAIRHSRIRHIFTRPYRPQTNGRAERFIQTLLRQPFLGRAIPHRQRQTPTWP